MHFNNKQIAVVIIMISLLFSGALTAQERAVRKAERKKELIRKLEKKYYEKDRRKTIRHRREMQTKETRQRMKETDKRARRFNKAQHNSWLEEQFRRKKPKR
jgi:hypothetical protein